MVSITGLREPIVDFAEDPLRVGVVRMQFEDLGHEDGPCEGPRCFQPEDAEDLVEEEARHRELGCGTFVVHCHAGISRSRGIEAAMTHIHGNDFTGSTPEHGMPNPHVVRTYIAAHNEVHGTSFGIPARFLQRTGSAEQKLDAVPTTSVR